MSTRILTRAAALTGNRNAAVDIQDDTRRSYARCQPSVGPGTTASPTASSSSSGRRSTPTSAPPSPARPTD